MDWWNRVVQLICRATILTIFNLYTGQVSSILAFHDAMESQFKENSIGDQSESQRTTVLQLPARIYRFVI
jgi:hypothetical protein